jgi:hypothetical protein
MEDSCSTGALFPSWLASRRMIPARNRSRFGAREVQTNQQGGGERSRNVNDDAASRVISSTRVYKELFGARVLDSADRYGAKVGESIAGRRDDRATTPASRTPAVPSYASSGEE